MDNNKEETNEIDNEVYEPEYRDRLRTWLVKMIHSGTIPGLLWENEEKTIFRMPWKHAGRQDYNLEEDSKIFMAWAKHSGRYREGIDKPEPIVWKTRLRCALNKMPDIRELPDRSRLDISEPYRVYHLLPPVHKASQIRRRLYKRSQSHDHEPLKSYSNHHLFNDRANEKKPWSFANHRKSSTESLAGFNQSALNYNSNLTPTPKPLGTPGFWFAPPANLPINPPMSSALGFQLGSRPVTDTPIHFPSALAPLQSRYPVIPPMASPFSFPPTTSMPSIMGGTAPLVAFRNQLALSGGMSGRMKQLSAHALGSEQKYQDHVAFDRNYENENDKNRSGERLYRNSSSSEQHGATDSESSKKNAEFQRRSNDFETRLQTLNALLGRDNLGSAGAVAQYHPLYAKLNESQSRIEGLESDLAEYRSAHAREKEAREKLEVERENMKQVLERMGNGLRTLAVHIHPRDHKTMLQASELQAQDEVFSRNSELVLRKHKNSPTPTSPATTSGSVSPGNIHHKTEDPKFLPFMPFVQGRRSPVGLHSVSASPDPYFKPTAESPAEKRKRPASPLDLTVSMTSPSKQRRTSIDDETNWSDKNSLGHTTPMSSQDVAVRPPLDYNTHLFQPSFSPDTTSADEKRAVRSPSSASSDSPLQVGSRQHESNYFRSRSESPSQRHHIQTIHSRHQGTIQVT